MTLAPTDFALFTAFVGRRGAGGAWEYATTTDVDFEISFDDGQTFVPVPSSGLPLVPAGIKLPNSRPLRYTVRVTPRFNTHWPVMCRFVNQSASVFSQEGRLATDDARLVEPSAWSFPTRVTLTESGMLRHLGIEAMALIHHSVYLSRVRDATAEALAQINVGAALKFPDNWLPEWSQGPLTRANVVAEPPVDGARRLDFRADGLSGSGANLLLEVRGVRAPQALAVYWPDTVSRIGATPFLVYFHPDLGQASQFFAGQPYPFSLPYLFFTSFRDLNYQGDPILTGSGAKGLITQVHASGRGAVIVAPMPRLAGHIGDALDASVMEELLREVQTFFVRRKNTYQVPAFGRVAVAGFSNGCGMHLRTFLDRNEGHPLLRDRVDELYLLDPRQDDSGLVRSVESWAKGGEDKRARVYLSAPLQPYLSLVRSSGFPLSAGGLTTPDGRRSLFLMEAPAWQELATRLGGATAAVPFRAFGPVHEVIPASMVVHALRSSGFPTATGPNRLGF